MRGYARQIGYRRYLAGGADRAELAVFAANSAGGSHHALAAYRYGILRAQRPCHRGEYVWSRKGTVGRVLIVDA